MKTISFIGCGNMAKAILRQLLAKEIVAPEEVIVTALHEESRQRLRREFPVRVEEDNKRAAASADYLFLAVKPQMYAGVIDEIKAVVKPEAVIITMAPGKSISLIKESFGREVKVIRTMPNTPAQVGAGMTAVCRDASVSEEEFAEAMKLLRAVGEAAELPEHLMDVAGAVSGASPAFMFLVLEGLADGAVAEGMPRAMAYRFAAQSMLGSASLLLETGKHPGELKDMVCSPAGTTIEGIATLEKAGTRSAMLSAVRACVEKSRRL